MHVARFLAILAAVPILTAAGSATPPVVAIEQGRLLGNFAGGIESFKGIPYAAPPVAGLRWRPPAAASGWNGVRDATAFRADCMQTPGAGPARPMAEDCLFLNVWRPAGARPGAKLPVMVWIHGGGLVVGSAAQPVYDGRAFARAGIVFVSLNYRLGRLGFFAFPALSREAAKGEPLGDYGYMDQMAALRWVRRNIARFGGDPQAVTVAGESSGGGSVVTLLTSPLARGLFSRAIVMSGGGRWAPPILRYIDRTSPSGVPSAQAVGANFARSVGIEGSDAAALARLRALPADRVIAGQALMTTTTTGDTHVGRSFVDGVLMPEPQDRSFAEGRIAPVPVMAGSTGGDIGFYGEPGLDAVYASFGAKADEARRLYDPGATGDFKVIATAVARDRNMAEPARFIVQAATAAGQPAYYYRFDYTPAAMRSQWKAGTPHGAELPFVFDTLDAAPYAAQVTPEDRAVAIATNRLWATFVKGARPWPAYREAPAVVMMVGPRPAAVADPLKPRLDLVEQAATYHAGAR